MGASQRAPLTVTFDEPMTVQEAAKVLRISRNAAYAAVRSGEIPCLRIGRTIRIPAKYVNEMLGAS